MAQERDVERGSALPPYRVWLCGTFRVKQLRSDTYTFVPPTQWGGSNYPRVLFKALLCCPERRGNRKTLLDILWSEIDSEQATAHFNTATTKLRRFLRPANAPGSLLITEATTSYALATQEILWVAALTLLKEAEQQGRTTRASRSLLEQAATHLNRGSFLEGEEGHWLSKQRKRLAEARYRCRLWLTEAYEQQSLPGQAESILSDLVLEDRGDEDALRFLMSFCQRQHLTTKALRCYEDSRQWFEQQHQCLSPATIGLTEQIRNGQREEEV